MNKDAGLLREPIQSSLDLEADALRVLSLLIPYAYYARDRYTDQRDTAAMYSVEYKISFAERVLVRGGAK